jgi:hypothetical protein
MQLPSVVRRAFSAALSLDPTRRPSSADLGRALRAGQQELGIEPTELLIIAPSRMSPFARAAVTDPEIFGKSVMASAGTVLRGARKVEDRIERHRARRASASVAFAATVTIAATAADLVTLATSARLHRLLIPLALAAAATVAVPVFARLLVLAERRRKTSFRGRALEISARMRNAYVSEIHALRPILTTIGPREPASALSPIGVDVGGAVARSAGERLSEPDTDDTISVINDEDTV